MGQAFFMLRYHFYNKWFFKKPYYLYKRILQKITCPILKKIVFTFIALCAAVLLQAQIFVFNDSVSTLDQIDIATSAQFANVGDSIYSAQQISSLQNQLPFQQVTPKDQNTSFTDANYWVVFSLQNNTSKRLFYYLETARPITDNVDLYWQLPNGDIAEQHSGDNMPLTQRQIPHRKTLFKIALEPHETYKAYIHYKSDGEVLSLPLLLYTPERFLERSYNEQLVFGLFYGVLLLAAVTYLFFYVGMRDKSFLYYGLYVIFIGLLQFSLDGLLYQYIMPWGGWLYLRSLILIAILSSFFMGKYAVNYLYGEKEADKAPKFFKAINILLAILFVYVLAVPAALKYSYPIANILGLAVLVSIIATIINKVLKHQKIDIFFALGFLFLVIGFVIFILNNLGILPNSIITLNSTKIGTGLEVVFLSLSMANRIWLLKSDKEKMQGLALQKAEEANELKNYFMSNMSHELRTPLNAIMGMVDVMLREEKDPKYKANFELIKNSSYSLLSSVNDVLDYSKIEKGEIVFEQEDFEPRKVISQIKDNWATQAENKGLTFKYRPSDVAPFIVTGDSLRLSQIVNNVLGNAVKFTQFGQIDFEIHCLKNNDDTVLIQLTISDTGIGIPKEKIESVFSSFSQENINNTRKYGGLGLGLSIVKELLSLQGGKINIESEVGKGTQCFIEIPYKLAKVQTQPKRETLYPKDEHDLLGAKLLIVEDDDVNQFIMKTILSRWKNTEITIVSDGSLALEALQNDTFDMVLMDLQMPVMDGYEATEEIRRGSAGEANIQIPIIAVTADTMESTRQRTRQIGMDDYMTKPVDQRLLYEKITNLLAKTVST